MDSIPRAHTGNTSIFPNSRALRRAQVFMSPPPSHQGATPIDRFASTSNNNQVRKEGPLTERRSPSSCFQIRLTALRVGSLCHPKTRPIHITHRRTRSRRWRRTAKAQRLRRRLSTRALLRMKALFFRPLRTTLPRAQPTKPLVTRVCIATRPWI